MGILNFLLNRFDNKKLDNFIFEKIMHLASPELKVWDKDDYLSFCRENGVENLIKIRDVTPKQAGEIYDTRFKKVCSENSIDIEKLFKDKMEVQKALYPEEFILLGGIEDVKKAYLKKSE